MRRLLLLALTALALTSPPALAQAPQPYVLRDSAGGLWGIQAFECNAATSPVTLCPGSVPMDTLGNPLTGAAGTPANYGLSIQGMPGGTPVPVTGSFSVSVGGFQPSTSGARGTPLAVSASDSSGPLPTGAVVVVGNAGNNTMYCNVNGIAATVADIPISAGGSFPFTIPSGVTVLHCITASSTTTANMTGGSGLAPGYSGGNGGGGGGGTSAVNLTQILGAAPSATNPLWMSPANGATFSVSGTFWPYSLGQVAMAQSVPVTIASNQSALSVSGTFWPYSLGQTTMSASVPVTLASNQSAVPISGAVTQASGPWTVNLTNWAGTALGAPSNYGTSPGAVAVPGVNAFVTNSPTVVATQSTGTNLHMVCDSGCSTSTAPQDEATFTPGTTSQSPVGGFFQTTATSNPLASGQMGAFQVTANRALFTNLRSSSGTELATASAPLQVSLANTGANGTALLVTGTAGTFPVTGTFWPYSLGQTTMSASVPVTIASNQSTLAVSAASLPLPSGAATSANQPTNAAQASTTSGQTGNLGMGAVTTAAPAYTTAQTDPLSLTTAGALRTDHSSLAGTALGAPSNYGTSPGAVEAQGVNAFVTNTVAFNLAQVNAVTVLTGAGAVGTGSQRIAVGQDTTTIAGSAPGTAGSASVNVLSVQGEASMTPLLTNPGTASNWGVLAQASSTSGELGHLAMGAVTSAAPSYTTAQTDPLSLDLAGNLRVNCITGCSSSGGSSLTDEGLFTQGTTAVTIAGGIYTTSPSNLVNGQGGALRATIDRYLQTAAATGPNITMQSGATANGNGTVLATNGYSTVILDVDCTVACSGGTTVNFEGTDATGNYVSISGFPLGGQSAAVNSVTNLTGVAMYAVNSAGLTNIRARISSYSAGTITVTGTPVAAGNSNTLAQVVNAAAQGQQTSSASNPVVIASDQKVSTQNTSAPINISTATTTQLVPLSGSTKIYVTAWDVIAGGSGNITLEYGTGSNCGTGTTPLTGAYPLTAQAGISKGDGTAPVLVVPSGNALCALTSAAVQMSGSVTTQQF